MLWMRALASPTTIRLWNHLDFCKHFDHVLRRIIIFSKFPSPFSSCNFFYKRARFTRWATQRLCVELFIDTLSFTSWDRGGQSKLLVLHRWSKIITSCWSKAPLRSSSFLHLSVCDPVSGKRIRFPWLKNVSIWRTFAIACQVTVKYENRVCKIRVTARVGCFASSVTKS